METVLQTVASTTSGVSASLATIQMPLGVGAERGGEQRLGCTSQGSQFLTMIQNLSDAVSKLGGADPAAAATLLLQLSQQFNAIAAAVHP